ncbi:MAG: glycoside hydrolase family 2 TIM barrel-domain containing protein [Rikenellaceae bacterium]
MNLKSLLYSSLCSLLLLLASCGGEQKINRESDFNFDWKFTLLDDTTTLKNLPLNDSNWRDVRLPHDWSVESSFSEDLEGCTGYLPGGVGVYQKHFTVDSDKASKSTHVLFDGVYNNAKFWLNGVYLGENPYGYSPISFDLTDILKGAGETNVLTVYVDHSRYADSRWYTGSGIYRNVKLYSFEKLHIPIWGTFITTPTITASSATVNIDVDIVNDFAEDKEMVVSSEIVDGAGNIVTKGEKSLKIAKHSKITTSQVIEVENPKLWDTENPNMYKAITSIKVGGKLLDQKETPFGIRWLVFDKDKGFFLNGKSTYAKGVCIHHDGGLVGAAVPDGVWRRRLEELKKGGVNAIRTSHNPFSESFLDLCDEMGFLVQNEIFDEMDNPKDKRFNMNEREVLYHTRGYTEHFQEWGESDLKRVIKRDRNHPSVFMYSIGNEIEWTYPHYKHVSGLWDPEVKGGYWNRIPHLTPEQMKARYDALPEREYVLAETAQKLSKWVKDMDTTRPVTANLIIPVASCVTGYAAALDVVGFSYQIAQYDWCKKHFPDMMFTGNENTGLLSEWKSITDNPMVFSMYMWTGIDYIGETNLLWPQKAWDGDMLDLGGFKKAGWNHFRAIWDDEPFVAIQTRKAEGSPFVVKNGKVISKNGKEVAWNNISAQEIWNYNNDEQVIVEVVGNLKEVELLLNGKSLGSQKLSECDDNIMRWGVPYTTGVLVAKGKDASGKEVTAELKSAGEPAAIKVDIDKTALASDGYDVAHIIVQLVDKDGVEIKNVEQKFEFEINGNITLLGVDNGWNKSTQDFQASSVVSHLGRALAIVQSKLDTKGDVTITVKSESLTPQTIAVKVE